MFFSKSRIYRKYKLRGGIEFKYVGDFSQCEWIFQFNDKDC